MKKIILFIIILTLCSCSAEYNLNINDTYEEKINTDRIYDTIVPAYNDYEGTSSEKEEGKKYYVVNDGPPSYSFNFAKNDYARSNAIYTCYKKFNVYTEDKVTTLLTSNYNYCFDKYDDLTNLTININLNSKYSLVRSNADQVKGNRYIWNINKDNYKNKYIYMAYELQEEDKCLLTCPDGQELVNANKKDCYCKKTEVKTEEDENSIIDYILLGAVLLLFIIGIISIIKYKSINNNEYRI